MLLGRQHVSASAVSRAHASNAESVLSGTRKQFFQTQGNREERTMDNQSEDEELDNSADEQFENSEFSKSAALGKQVKNILESNSENAQNQGNLLFRHNLFTQLDILCHFPPTDNVGWKEMSRWLKYEEKVDAGGRWSKPHVGTSSFRGLSLLRWAIAENRCLVLLDASTSSGSAAEVFQLISHEMGKHFCLDDTTCSRITEVLQKPHKHKHRKSDAAKNTENSAGKHQLFKGRQKRAASMTTARRKSLVRREGKDLWSVYTAYPKGITPDNLKPYTPNKRMMKKLPVGTEVANVLVGQLEVLDEPVFVFCRLEPPVVLEDACEVTFPTRFLFLAFGTSSATSLWELSEIGRAAAGLFNDKVFSELAYVATDRQDILAGVDEFIDSLTYLPPSVWDPTTRLDPPMNAIRPDKIAERLTELGRKTPQIEPVLDGTTDDNSLYRSGRIFGGLCSDVKTRYRYYKSDFLDGINLQCVASAVFLYFACITPIVTFGGLMEKKTNGFMGTIEMLLAGAICGFFYALFSGQPLTIVGATGPLLVFEGIVYEICHRFHVDFMSFRCWIGIWIFLYLFIIVALDLSCLVRFITRFTEECFAVLISVIFIYEAVVQVVDIWKTNPVKTGVDLKPSNFSCFCVRDVTEGGDSQANLSYVNGRTWLADQNNSVLLDETCVTAGKKIEIRYGCITKGLCSEYRWNVSGEGCVPSVTDSVPDVFLLSCVLLFGTFAVAIFFRNLKTTHYFPLQVRTTLGDFAVFLSVVLWTGIDAAFSINTPKLNVPENFTTTSSERSWLINPLDCTYWWLAFLAAFPGILATILIFLDQQITAVIVNRKEHKLVKGHGYHLDLLVLACLVAACSVLGLPWFCAATVRSISHVQSLVRESEVRAPGERPVMLGIREQRLTGICIHVLIAFSMLSAPVLKYIPMPVLYGVFLYMGVTSLNGVQFVERILILLMPVKYQPDYIYLRHVHTYRVHAFTLIQVLCFAMMWIIKMIKVTSIAFPLMLLALMVVRKAMDYIFTQRELYWLDHLLPDEHRRKQEDLLKAIENAKNIESIHAQKKLEV